MESQSPNPDGVDPRIQELLSHSSWIRKLAFALVRDAQLAEDVTQEVLIAALKQPTRRGTLLRRWLATVTRRQALNWARGRQRSQRREERVARVEGVEQGPNLDIILAYREVMDAMKCLQPKQKQVLLLRFHEELSFKEIAASLSIQEGSARVRLHRALEALRIELGEGGKDWKSQCILLAPGALGRPASAIPFPSLSMAASLLLILGVLGVWWWQSGMAQPNEKEPTLAATLDHDSEASGEEAPILPEGIERRELPGVSPELPDLPPTDRTLQGRVLRMTEGVAGAEIQVWQPSQQRTIYSEADGTFSCELLQGEKCVITAIAGGHSRKKGFSAKQSGPLIFHMPPVGDREPTKIYVQDAGTGEAIEDARVRIYVSPGLRELALANQSDQLEPEFDLMTDSEGVVSFSGYTQDLYRGIHIEASGYLPNWSALGGSGSWDDSLVKHVNLEKGNPRSIQFVNRSGVPVAGARVRSGFPASSWETTDENGFAPPIQSWTLAMGLEEGGEPPALPTAITATFPGGKTWNATAPNLHPSQVRFFEKKIQFIIDQEEYLLTLECSSLLDGEWIEASARTEQSHRSAHRRWTKLSPGKSVTASLNDIGRIYGFDLRLMPQGIPLPDREVEPGDRSLVIPVEIKRQVLILEGPSVDKGLPLFAEIDWGSGLSWTTPMIQGRAILPQVEWPSSMNIEVTGEDGQPLWVEFTLDYPEVKSYVGPKGLALNGQNPIHLREVFTHLEEVSVFVNGLPVLGGRVNEIYVSPNGTVQLAMKESGSPIVQRAKLDLPASLHQQPGGPIFAYISPPEGQVKIGQLQRDRSGKWTWKLELASVELLVPPNPDRKDSRLVETLQGLHPWVDYPYHMTSDERFVFGSDSVGGWLAFRVPAGRYRFKVGEHFYAGEEGVDILSGRINRLEPIGVVAEDEEEQ